MPDVLPPVDPSVVVPAIVKQAAEAADKLHKAAYPDQHPETPPEQPPQSPPEQQQPPPEQQQPSLEQPPEQPHDARAQVPDSGEHGSWEHRYLAMKGRYDQSQRTIGQIQEQMSQLGDELMRTQQALQLARRGEEPRPRRQNGATPRSVTEKDIETYGPELADFVARAARDAVAPDLNQVTQQVRQTTQQVRLTAHQRMEADLDGSIPDWRQINTSPRFKQWVGLRDIYSGAVRRDLISEAAKAADAPRVAAFFRAFLAEEQATGQMPAPQTPPTETPPPRQPAVQLDTLAAPGRAKPASGNGYAAAADKPIITRAQIRAFYSNDGIRSYVGREADRKRDEQIIMEAQREGRVR